MVGVVNVRCVAGRAGIPRIAWKHTYVTRVVLSSIRVRLARTLSLLMPERGSRNTGLSMMWWHGAVLSFPRDPDWENLNPNHFCRECAVPTFLLVEIAAPVVDDEHRVEHISPDHTFGEMSHVLDIHPAPERSPPIIHNESVRVDTGVIAIGQGV